MDEMNLNNMNSVNDGNPAGEAQSLGNMNEERPAGENQNESPVNYSFTSSSEAGMQPEQGPQGNNGGYAAGYNQEPNRYSFPVSPEPSKSPYFYTESFNKKSTRKSHKTLFQMIAVALVSSILGGAIVGSAILFAGPALEPTIRQYIDKESTDTAAPAANNQTGTDNSVPTQNLDSSTKNTWVTTIAEKVGPSVVGVRIKAKVQDFFFGEQDGSSEGSGIIIRSNGYIMTNFHVIQGAIDGTTGKAVSGATIEVILPSQTDKSYTATVVGYDWRTDLAVLKIDATNLAAVTFGDSNSLKVGEPVVAIGNPGGMEYAGSITVGVISGLNRTVSTDDGKSLTYIQTDAAINPGNSGGALVNSDGKLVGVNTVKVVATGFEGLGFAIPVNTVKEVTDSLIEHKYVTGRPGLGITVETDFNAEVAKTNNVPVGVMIREVSPLGAAYKAGLQRMDIILKLEGTTVKSYNELLQALSKFKPGDSINIEYYRDGKTSTAKVTLMELKQ